MLFSKLKPEEKTSFTPFRWRLLLLLLLFLGTTSTVGYLLFRDLSNIVNQTLSNTEPSYRLLLLRDITTELKDAEKAVSAYSIYHDDNVLFDYYEKVEELQSKIDSVSSLQFQNEQIAIDSVSQWISKLLVIWDQSIRLESSTGVTAALDNLIDKIKESQLQEAPQNNILKNLFKSRERQKEESLKTEQELLNEINKLEQSEAAIAQRNQRKRLAFFKQSQKLLTEINTELKRAEEAEVSRLKEKATWAAQQSAEVRQKLIWLGMALLTILLFVIYSIVIFIRKDKRYKKALIQTVNEAKELSETKQRFLASVSHEIRTPLHALLGHLEQLEKGNQKTENLKTIRHSAYHLNRIVSDILDYTKMAVGEMKIVNKPFNLSDLANECYQLFEESAQSKRLDFQLHSSEEIDEVWVLGDETRVKQILMNLLSNAIKFTEKGKVSLHVNAKVENKKVALEFSVEDTGVGIPEEKQATIFDDFNQGSEDVAITYGGSGLGLAIVKQITDRMDGDLELKSSEQKGTQIKVLLQLDIANPPKEKKEEHIDKLDFSAHRFLVVDDDPFNRNLLSSILQQNGGQVQVAGNGEVALEKAKETCFSMIFLDLQMPKMDGETALKCLKEIEQCNETNFVVMSASVSGESIQVYKSKGFHQVLPKPFSEKQLQQVVQNSLVNDSEKQSKSFASLDFSDLRYMLNNDEQLIHSMLEELQLNISKNTKAILEEKDIDVAALAHKMAPGIKHINAKSFYTLLKKIENGWESAKNNERELWLQEVERLSQEVIAAVQTELEDIKKG